MNFIAYFNSLDWYFKDVWYALVGLWFISGIGISLILKKFGRTAWTGYIPVYNVFQLYSMAGHGTNFVIALILILARIVIKYGGLVFALTNHNDAYFAGAKLMSASMLIIQIAMHYIMCDALAKKFGEPKQISIGLFFLLPLLVILLGTGPYIVEQTQEKAICQKSFSRISMARS